MCRSADDKLTAFVETLQLECLEMFKDDSGEHSKDGNEKNTIAELPQVSCIIYYCLYLYVNCWLLLNVCYVKAIDQLLCCVPGVVGTATSRKIKNVCCWWRRPIGCWYGSVINCGSSCGWHAGWDRPTFEGIIYLLLLT